MVAKAGPGAELSLQFSPVVGVNVDEIEFVADKDGEGEQQVPAEKEQQEEGNIFDKNEDNNEQEEVVESKEELPDTSECELVCPSNSTDFVGRLQQSDEAVKLKFLTHQYGWWTLPIAEAYNELMRGQVQVEVVQVPVSELFPNIENEAESQIGLYDGFFTGPGVLGSVVDHEGFADLTDYIQESADRSKDWLDVLLGYRQEIAQYEDKILMYPLDGDTLSLFYRKDILDAFGLKVPRTWDEYNQVAAATHGKVWNNQTLVGSCVARKTSCSNAYWANLVLSTMTQTNGPSQGHLFDTKDLTPQTGEALEETLALLEEQAKYGAEEEFGDGCIGPVNFDLMFKGKCVLTYNWGNSFKRYLEPGTALAGSYGVAPTPGSQKVLDRETMKLVDCTAERCQHAEYFDDLGYVNRAPYLAFGGWACAVNNYTSDRKKRLAMDFCAFAASQKESIKAVIPEAKGNVTVAGRPATQNGQDPFRTSHLDLEMYVEMGYERETSADFIDAIKRSLESPNLVKDIRFPTNADIYSVLDTKTHAYLSDVMNGNIAESDRPARRTLVSQLVTNEWTDLIAAHDSKSSTKTPVLEAYQRLRNVYSPEVDENYLQGIRGYGIVLASIIIFLSIVFGLWTIRYRATKVVRGSQPFFLLMLLSGCIVFGSAIIPLGIDDESHSTEAASKACQSVMWLVALGWSIIFSALFSKLWRVNIVYKNSMQFRRLKVSEKDVLLPFVLLFSSNLIILIIWTVLDPLVWRRVEVSETESYGTCAADPDSDIWKICLSILASLNSLALILANVEAYKARNVSTEYGESKHIGMIMASILQIVLVGLPLLFLVDDNPTASYFIRSSIVFVISMSVILLIFVPKIHIWYKGLDSSKSQGSRKDSIGRRGSGLRFTIREDPSVVAQRAGKLIEYREKIKHLEQIMVERGIDVQPLFQEAGINMDSLVENGDMAAHAKRVASLAKTTSVDSNPYPSSIDSEAEPRLESVPESSAEMNESSSPPEQRPLN